MLVFLLPLVIMVMFLLILLDMGLIDSLLNLGATNMTNNTNRLINQQNNEFNAAEAEKNREYQTMMWNKTNEYNSPQALRQRYLDAGLNPALMMQGQSAGYASSSQGSAASAASPIPMQAPHFNFSSIPETLASIANSSYAFSKSEGQKIENLNLPSRITAEINKMIGDTDFFKLSPDAQKFYKSMGSTAAHIQMDTLTQQLKNLEYTGNLTQAQTSSVYLDAQAQSVINRYLDQQQQMELKLKASTLANNVEYRNLTRKQAQVEIAKALETYARTKGIRIQNRIAESTADSLIESNLRMNNYTSSYYRHAIPYAGSDYENDNLSKLYDRRMKGIQYKEGSRDYQRYGLRRAIEYGSQLFQGFGSVSSGVGNFIGNVRERPAPVYNHYKTDKYIYNSR
jgi:hypothetical protein